MKTKTQINLLLIGLFFTVNSALFAQTKPLIYEGFRQGTSWQVYLLNKQLAKTIKLGGETRKLYLVNLEINNSYDGINRQTNLIQCSTQQPFVAFAQRNISRSAIIHFINPGGELAGYNTESHWLYWTICHNLWQPWQANLNFQASKLNYSTQLEERQIELPIKLLQNLK